MEIIYQPKHTEGIRALDTMYPTYAMYFISDIEKQGMGHSTTYGYLLTGSATITANGQDWNLQEGNYFAFHGEFSVKDSKDLNLWTVTKLGYRCMPMVGQIENNGRLSYIDGCSDSVLVSMPRMGDPVLNYLHFPTGIYQTQHTHGNQFYHPVTAGAIGKKCNMNPSKASNTTIAKRIQSSRCCTR